MPPLATPEHAGDRDGAIRDVIGASLDQLRGEMGVADQSEFVAEWIDERGDDDPIAGIDRVHSGGCSQGDGTGEVGRGIITRPQEQRIITPRIVREQPEFITRHLKSHIKWLIEIGLYSEESGIPIARSTYVCWPELGSA
jgi:hypothetical protein